MTEIEKLIKELEELNVYGMSSSDAYHAHDLVRRAASALTKLTAPVTDAELATFARSDDAYGLLPALITFLKGRQ